MSTRGDQRQRPASRDPAAHPRTISRHVARQHTLLGNAVTLLGNAAKRRRYWDRRRSEIYLDRHRPTFQAVLYYYQSGGRLRRPIEVPDDVFLEELEFYEISDAAIGDYKVKEGFLLEKVSGQSSNGPPIYCRESLQLKG